MKFFLKSIPTTINDNNAYITIDINENIAFTTLSLIIVYYGLMEISIRQHIAGRSASGLDSFLTGSRLSVRRSHLSWSRVNEGTAQAACLPNARLSLLAGNLTPATNDRLP